jgi:acyl-CoA thioester hydrolase
MRHKSQLQIRWADLDAFKHVNNAAYLVYMQEARADFTWYSRKVIAPIHDVDIPLDIESYLEKIGNSSFVMIYEMSQAGQLRAKGKTVQVGVDMQDEKSRPLRDYEIEYLKQYLEPGSKE